MSTSTWSRLRWPFKALLIALPIIAFSYFAITRWMVQSPVDNSEIDRTCYRWQNPLKFLLAEE